MNRKNPKVDAFLDRAGKWQKEFRKLRTIALDCGLTEELKWGKPCYTFEDRNIIIVQGFKEFCALLFPNGVLLKDPNEVLESQGANTQAARRITFTSVASIAELEPAVRDCIREVIAVNRAGLKVKFKKTSEFDMPAEFQTRLDEDPSLRRAFDSLTPGRQRAYLLHFASAKQSSTRASRVEKCTPRIRQGKGLTDR